MLDLAHSKLYARAEDEKLLKSEPDYLQDRYYTIIKTLIDAPFRWTRQKGAEFLHISKRHMQRLVKSFKEKGIPGLHLKSKIPKSMPKKSKRWLENAVISMKRLTGFGKTSISTLVNEQFRLERYTQRIGPSLTDRILARNKKQKPPIEVRTEFKHFDWKRPNNLIQSDITRFNGVPILSMEDDHSRYVWSDIIDDETAKNIAAGMNRLVPFKFNNLLTDNGPQFSNKNESFSEYVKRHVIKNHIHSSICHPRTLGKISAYQKGLKHFLGYKLKDSCSRLLIRPLIKAYNLFYNNGRRHRIIDGIPSLVYFGAKNEGWFTKMMRILKPGKCRGWQAEHA